MSDFHPATPTPVRINLTGTTDGSPVSTANQMPVTDPRLTASLGLVTGYETVNKFGHAIDCDNDDPTDIWDGADGVTAGKIWIPPTAARIHTIVSSDLADSDSGGVNPQSTGARTVRIHYLPDWDTAEATEDVVLDGTTGIAMSNAAVIIHVMEILTWGSGGLNVGIIKATAATDATITAAILVGENQTQMCIYGIPSTQRFRMYSIVTSILKTTGGTAKADCRIYRMRDPAVNVVNNKAWTDKEHYTVVEAIGPWQRHYDTPKKFDGPCILKIQVTMTASNVTATGGFCGHIVDN